MKNELLPIQPGTRVRVSDWTPQPPARFKRKLADWEKRNFDAIVVGEEAPGKYGAPEPVYRLQFGDLNMSRYMVFYTTRSPKFITALEEQPTYAVEMRGLDPQVVGMRAT